MHCRRRYRPEGFQKLVIAAVEAAFYLDFVLACVEFIDELLYRGTALVFTVDVPVLDLDLAVIAAVGRGGAAAAGECREHQCGGKYGRDCTFFVRHGFVSS